MKRAKDVMLMLALFEVLDQLAMANCVGMVCSEDGVWSCLEQGIIRF